MPGLKCSDHVALNLQPVTSLQTRPYLVQTIGWPARRQKERAPTPQKRPGYLGACLGPEVTVGPKIRANSQSVVLPFESSAELLIKAKAEDVLNHPDQPWSQASSLWPWPELPLWSIV